MWKRSGLSIAVIALALVAITASPVAASPVSSAYFHAWNTLDNSFPSATTPQQADSGPLKYAGGDDYKLIGYWTHDPNLGVGGDLHLWLGLTNSDDQGTRFDIGVVVSDGGTTTVLTKLCIAGLTRNPALAREVILPLGYVGGTAGTTLVAVFARIGTNPDDTKCPGHGSASGLRLYYDSVSRPSGIYH